MKRRLYFLLPDSAHTRSVADELITNGIDPKNMHVIAAKDVDLEDLPPASCN